MAHRGNVSTASTTPAPRAPASVIEGIVQDDLLLEEISLVPGGANQGADILVAKSDPASTPESLMQRVRAAVGQARTRMTELVTKLGMTPDDASPVLADLESAAMIAAAPVTATPAEPAAVAKHAPEGGESSPHTAAAPAPSTDGPGSTASGLTATPAAPSANAGALPSAQAATRPTSGVTMSAAAAEQGTNTGQQPDLGARLTEATQKAAQLEQANQLLAARVEKMEQESRDRELTAKTAALFDKLPGKRDALKALVAKLDPETEATLKALCDFTREAMTTAKMFVPVGVDGDNAASQQSAQDAFDAKVAEVRKADPSLSYDEATVKAMDTYPDLAKRVQDELRAAIQR
jgi:hypothetical protein